MLAILLIVTIGSGVFSVSSVKLFLEADFLSMDAVFSGSKSSLSLFKLK